jgi:polyvinyl alcohol dehydrogenase (cytochrome)
VTRRPFRTFAVVAGICVLPYVGSGFSRTFAAQQPLAGAAVYKDFCAQCHDNPTDRTPDLAALRSRTPEAALAALSTGSMAVHAQKLSTLERRAVAEFVAGRPLSGSGGGAAAASTAACAHPARSLNLSAGSRWTGWGADLANTRYQPQPGLDPADVPKLALKWAFGFPGGSQAYAQPTIVSGRVFTGSDNGTVYALDAASGCTLWAFKADRGVRTAVVIGALAGTPGRVAAYFGDLAANVYGVDAASGALMWKQKADDHRFARITGAPALHDGRLYVPVSSVEEASAAQPAYPCCSFRGSVIAYDAATGRQIWKSYTIAEAPEEVGKTRAGTPVIKPAGAAVWNSPTIDAARGALYVGTGNAYTEPAADSSDAVVAMDLNSGKILWVNQITPADAFVMNCRGGVENCPQELGPDFDFGNSPILRALPGGRRIIVIGQKSGVAYGLDPDANGKKVWEYRAGKGTALGGMEWGSAADEQNAYLPVSDVLLPAAQSGGLHAVRLATGERVWHTPAPALSCTTGRGCTGAQSAPVSVIPGVVFSGSMDGHMRAYSTAEGRIVWEFNTARDFETVNGVPAKGGSIDAAGPAVAEGLLVTPSGYALFRGNPGNVLLAFGVK